MAIDRKPAIGWTLFRRPDRRKITGGAPRSVAFTLFVGNGDLAGSIEACFVDKYGPSIVVMFGGVIDSHRLDLELTRLTR